MQFTNRQQSPTTSNKEKKMIEYMSNWYLRSSFVINMYIKRTVIRLVICFCILGGLALAFCMVREVNQSNKYGFEVEKDDIVRYSFAGAIGYIINISIIFMWIGFGWFEWHKYHYCFFWKGQGFYTLALFCIYNILVYRVL